MFRSFITVLFVSLAVSGCKVTPAKQVYTPPTTNQKINVYSLIPQDELEAVYPVQNSSAATAQFGLIGALVGAAIDTSVNKSNAEVAEDNLAFIRNELLSLDFDQLFEEELIKKLEGKINIGTVQTIKSQKTLQDKLVAGETYLLLTTQYKMDIDFRTPFIVSNISLHERGIGKVKDKLLYKNTFTFFGLSLPEPSKSEAYIDAEIAEINKKFAQLSKAEQNKYDARIKRQKKIKKARKPALNFDDANEISAMAWSTEYKEELNLNLRAGIQKLFALIATDISDDTLPETYAKSGQTLDGYPSHHKSLLLENTDTHQVIRFTEGARAGAICSMPKDKASGKLVCL